MLRIEVARLVPRLILSDCPRRATGRRGLLIALMIATGAPVSAVDGLHAQTTSGGAAADSVTGASSTAMARVFGEAADSASDGVSPAALGALLGAGAGLLFVRSECSDDMICLPGYLLFGVGGAAIGALIGHIIGSVSAADREERRLRPVVVPAPRGNHPAEPAPAAYLRDRFPAVRTGTSRGGGGG